MNIEMHLKQVKDKLAYSSQEGWLFANNEYISWIKAGIDNLDKKLLNHSELASIEDVALDIAVYAMIISENAYKQSEASALGWRTRMLKRLEKDIEEVMQLSDRISAAKNNTEWLTLMREHVSYLRDSLVNYYKPKNISWNAVYIALGAFMIMDNVRVAMDLDS